jgi:segregation and condensation protein B
MSKVFQRNEAVHDETFDEQDDRTAGDDAEVDGEECAPVETSAADDAEAIAGADDVMAGLGATLPGALDNAVDVTTESTVEAILFATDAPLSAKKIAQILGAGDARDVKKHIAALNAQYAATGRSFRIEEIAKGYQMLTVPAYNNWLRQVLRVRDETKLSPAAMETLAIIAYKQPILRADVEAIRGVACGEVINRLREMNLVKIVGRAEELGRPLLYGTTSRFLEVFGLGSLEDLPNVEELTPPGA